MKLKTGLLKIDIAYDNGDKGEIFYNPTDPQLYKRLLAFSESIGEKMKGFESTAEGLANAGDMVEAELNEIFCTDVSSVLFRYVSPFTVMPDGTAYLTYVSEELAKEIKSGSEKTFKKFADKNEKLAKKYLKNYEN